MFCKKASGVRPPAAWPKRLDPSSSPFKRLLEPLAHSMREEEHHPAGSSNWRPLVERLENQLEKWNWPPLPPPPTADEAAELEVAHATLRRAASPQGQQQHTFNWQQHDAPSEPPSFLRDDWTLPSASEERERVDRLLVRFPQLARSVVQHALDEHRGHAGHTAAALSDPSLRRALSEMAMEAEQGRRAAAEAGADEMMRLLSEVSISAAASGPRALTTAQQSRSSAQLPTAVRLPPPGAVQSFRDLRKARARGPGKPPPSTRAVHQRLMSAGEAVAYLSSERLEHTRRMSASRAFAAFLQGEMDPTDTAAKATALLSASLWSAVAQLVGGSAGYWHLADEWLTLNGMN